MFVNLFTFTLCNAAVPTVGSLQPFCNKTGSEILTLLKGCAMAKAVLILKQSTWNLWWAKCHWIGFPPYILVFTQSVS